MSFFTRKLILHVILPLIVGLAIYILFRSNTWVHHYLFPPGLYTISIQRTWLSNIFVFNVPDLCWSYSLSSALFIWKGSRRFRYFPLLLLLLVVAAEAAQYFFPSSFTFDWLDIAATILGFLLSYLATGKNDKG